MLFVTGINGHSGRHFLQRLVDEQYNGKVRCTVSNSTNIPPLNTKNLDVEYVVCDLNNVKEITKAMSGSQIVLHIAHIKYSKNILQACIDNDVDWVINVHTTGRYSKFKSASAEYIEIEDYILTQRDKLAITIVRPTMIYGSSRDKNMVRLIKFLDKSKFFPMFGKGDNLMQPVHAKDLGNAYYDIILKSDVTKNKEYNLSGKNPIKYKKLIQTVSKELGKKTIILHIPMGLSVFAAKIYNAIFKNAIITVEQVLRMQEDKAFSHDLASNDFGYSPYSFEEGIKEEVIEYLESKKK
ncbi:NAD-dependent epimerase/dehydratase family protein [Turicibacter sanguinis]|uniref:NAD-dependent epimerase/dehydratase family protein n=1 Tax=Turicibacter sanguinis TaxID=154288 RepID=UPI00232DF62F|nr:NAD-dependent epimerase/dehydratase family protein [Turicibacter sanguinis]MDB8542317.1 NAD-dependent epimerase/dehydratase family protein [Turicibacter sanguinis]